MRGETSDHLDRTLLTPLLSSLSALAWAAAQLRWQCIMLDSPSRYTRKFASSNDLVTLSASVRTHCCSSSDGQQVSGIGWWKLGTKANTCR